MVYFDDHSIEAFCDKAYPGVEMKRKLLLKGDILCDEFDCISDTIHQYDYVLLLTEQPQIEGEFTGAKLDEAVAYKQIRNVKRSVMNHPFTVSTPTGKITFRVDGVPSFELFVGEVSGIPPTNPDIVTKTGTERRPVETCYPLMIRVKDKNMTVRAQWDIF